MFWKIEYYPKCDFHVFLSHSAEDRESLIGPVYRKLIRNGIVPWIDKHDYPYGRSSRSALRDSVLQWGPANFSGVRSSSE